MNLFESAHTLELLSSLCVGLSLKALSAIGTLISSFALCVGGRCRQENEYAYFLSMLSERYGYIMDPDDVPADIKARSVNVTDIMSYGPGGHS